MKTKINLKTIQRDFVSSIVVFLVAVPLCLGIAIASGVPPISGLLAGIIGGIVVGSLSGSHVSVSGPAAGLVTVTIAGIMKVGSYENFILAVMMAGIIQFTLGAFKYGAIANYIPSSVIKGMLVGIGIIIIQKQIPVIVGSQNWKGILTEFSYGAICISIICFTVILIWDKSPLKRIRFIPSTIIGVIIGILVNLYIFPIFFPNLTLSNTMLVNLPTITGWSSLVTFPNFSQITNYNIWVVAITIVLIGSLETLISLEALTNLDRYHRLASPNQELMAQGFGNTLSGMLGGLPITEVIVRSSTNVYAGAETRLSTIFHGILLLISVLFLTSVLNLIPKAALAILLVVTGYKLAHPSIFIEFYNKGKGVFLPFIATVIVVIIEDLLIGVMAGMFGSHNLFIEAN